MGFGGKAMGKGSNFEKRRKGWVCVKVVSQSGTGNSMCVVRHERDPKVFFSPFLFYLVKDKIYGKIFDLNIQSAADL